MNPPEELKNPSKTRKMNALLSPAILNHVVTYNTNKFPFYSIIERVLLSDNNSSIELIELHSLIHDFNRLISRETDQSTEYHKAYYTNNHQFLKLYVQFIHEVIRPIFNEEIVYQRIPTFRVQFPDNKGVGEFHRDADYNHNPEEINFFLPFTDAVDTSTIWIETEPGKEDYYPLNAQYGQVVMFNGCHLKHGNKINTTGRTRMSVDFRVIPLSQYKEEAGKASINTKMGFRIGEYYAVTIHK